MFGQSDFQEVSLFRDIDQVVLHGLFVASFYRELGLELVDMISEVLVLDYFFVRKLNECLNFIQRAESEKFGDCVSIVDRRKVLVGAAVVCVSETLDFRVEGSYFLGVLFFDGFVAYSEVCASDIRGRHGGKVNASLLTNAVK